MLENIRCPKCMGEGRTFFSNPCRRCGGKGYTTLKIEDVCKDDVLTVENLVNHWACKDFNFLVEITTADQKFCILDKTNWKWNDVKHIRELKESKVDSFTVCKSEVFDKIMINLK